jgi:hypothetical protein
MNVRMEGLPAAFQEDAFRFTAGAVAQKVFLISDIVAFTCAMVAGVSLLGLIFLGRLSAKRPSSYFRCLAFGVALASLAAILFVVTPNITAASKDHLNAAKAGDAAAATIARQAVANAHPIATNLLVAEFLGAVAALFLGAWAAGETDPSAPASARSQFPAYPKPDLLKRKRS